MTHQTTTRPITTSQRGTTTVDQNDQQTPDRSEFAAFLVGHLGGRTHEEIGTELHHLIEAVRETGKKGSLVVTVVIDPPAAGMDGGPLSIGIESTLKAPKPTAPRSIYFVDAEGNPTRQDPRQLSFDSLRTAPANTDLRSI